MAMERAANSRLTVRDDSAARRDAFDAQLKSWRARMELALEARLPDSNTVPARLHQAMRYSVLGGGKRVRPMLLFATAGTLGLAEHEGEAAACAVELVHVYSLVHDDLPAMDDDDLRRGRPTCHKAFDEATAVLVGDALQPLAFQLLARDPQLPADPAIRLKLIELLAEASGTFGMAGGHRRQCLPAAHAQAARRGTRGADAVRRCCGAAAAAGGMVVEAPVVTG